MSDRPKPHDLHKYEEDEYGVFTLKRSEMRRSVVMRHTYHDGTWLEKEIIDEIIENARDPKDVYDNTMRLLQRYARIRFGGVERWEL